MRLGRRFISGRDYYGAGFTKHNTNSGFVDTSLRRKTPQIFSAFSFYASKGTRLVADIQGVSDLFTDPQVLSSDYRFGDGDLGPRGMALFFKGFRHHYMSDALGIPIFALSKNELRVQEKYTDDEETISTHDTRSYYSEEEHDHDIAYHPYETLDDEHECLSHNPITKAGPKNRFEKLDLNRLRRSTLLLSPRHILRQHQDEFDACTEKRTNISRTTVSKSIRLSLRLSSPTKKHVLHRSRSEVDEVTQVSGHRVRFAQQLSDLMLRVKFTVSALKDLNRTMSSHIETSIGNSRVSWWNEVGRRHQNLTHRPLFVKSTLPSFPIKKPILIWALFTTSSLYCMVWIVSLRSCPTKMAMNL